MTSKRLQEYPTTEILDYENVIELTRQRMEGEIAETRRRKEQEMQVKKEKHRELVQEIFNAKKLAEQNFPNILLKIQNEIKSAIRNGQTEYKWYVKVDDVEALNVMMMLISALQMQEFNCRYSYEEYSKNPYISIRW